MARKVVRKEPSLLEALRTAHDSKYVSLPAFKVGPYVIAYSPLTRLAYAAKWGTFLGAVTEKGFRATKGVKKADRELVEGILEYPLRSAQTAAENSECPVCACCGRTLGRRSGDRDRGIGRGCWVGWGFDQDVKKVQPKKKSKSKVARSPRGRS